VTLFLVYGPDGEIIQANKMYDPPVNHGKLLDDLGQKYIAVELPNPVHQDGFYIDVKASELCERPIMPISVSKNVIKAGGNDSTLIRDIPTGVTFAIVACGAAIYPAPGQSDILDGTELEISIPVPCVYTVILNKWPYKTFKVEIEAVS
jgi:hypothetical protein